MGWKWWIKAYFKTVFSREMWFSTFFVVMEVLMILDCLGSESRIWRQPILHIAMCLGSLLAIAITLAALAILQAYLNGRYLRKVEEKMRLEAERHQSILQEYIRQCELTEMLGKLSSKSEPEEPKISPWFLGEWDTYLKGE
jgi:hypothetical protein